MLFNDDGSFTNVALGVCLVLSFFVASILALFMDYLRKRRISNALSSLAEDGQVENKTPICMVTGFLGSGKTTLLNHILESPDLGKKLAVVVNEVGAVSVDHELIKQNLSDDGSLMVMKNGCMCCVSDGSLGSNELGRILTQLVKLKDQRGAKLDGVVIELSGLADPTPTVQTFMSEEFFHTKFYLDSIVCMVDFSNFSGNFRKDKLRELERQLVYATLVVLNKSDLIEGQEDEKQECYDIVSTINSLARTYESTFSKVPLDILLNQNAFNEHAFASTSTSMNAFGADHGHNHNHGREAHVHTKGIASVSVITSSEDKMLQPELLYTWLDDILKKLKGKLYRCKGIVYLDGQVLPFVLQGVQSSLRMNQMEGGLEPNNCPGNSAIVFIGVGLNQRQLQKGFDACKLSS